MVVLAGAVAVGVALLSEALQKGPVAESFTQNANNVTFSEFNYSVFFVGIFLFKYGIL